MEGEEVKENLKVLGSALVVIGFLYFMIVGLWAIFG